MSAWRCFVAVPIGEDLRAALAAGVEAWRATPDGTRLRWTEPASWHVTLAFLAAIDPERVPSIQRALDEAASRDAEFSLATGGIGAFPSRNAARVVWYGIDDGEGRLDELARRVRRALGVDTGAPFHAHLTLARARRERGERLDGWLGLQAALAPSGSLAVAGIELYRSHLGAGPARYESLWRAPLGGGLHV